MLRWLVGEAVEQLGRHAQSGVPHAARLEDALGLRHQEAGRARVLLVGTLCEATKLGSPTPLGSNSLV